MTPLHVACQVNNFDMAKLLLQLGADSNISEKSGKKAIEYVKQEDRVGKKIAKLIEKAS